MKKDLKEEDFTERIKATNYGKEIYESFQYAEAMKLHLKKKEYKQALENFSYSILTNEKVINLDEELANIFIKYLESRKNQESDFNVLVFMFRFMMASDLKQTLKYIDFSLQLSELKWTNKLLNFKSGIYALLGKFNEALKIHQDLYKISKRYEHLSSMGFCYLQLKKYKESFKMFKSYNESSKWCDREKISCEYALAYLYLSFEQHLDSPGNPEKTTESFIFHMMCALIAERYQFPFIEDHSYPDHEELCMNHYRSALENICFLCGKEANKGCSKCNLNYYCSAECQKKDWGIHKLMCKQREKKPKTSKIVKHGKSDFDNKTMDKFSRMMMMETNKEIQKMVVKSLPNIEKRILEVTKDIEEPYDK